MLCRKAVQMLEVLGKWSGREVGCTVNAFLHTEIIKVCVTFNYAVEEQVRRLNYSWLLDIKIIICHLMLVANMAL